MFVYKCKNIVAIHQLRYHLRRGRTSIETRRISSFPLIYSKHRRHVSASNCRSFFELLSRFSQAGLVQYGHSYEKDCVYFLGRECYESLNGHDRLRVFAYHQSHLYRLVCLKFVELLFESFEIFLQTFQQMNSATTIIIDEIFEKEILQQIQHDQRYRALNNRDNDRHRQENIGNQLSDGKYMCWYSDSWWIFDENFVEKRFEKSIDWLIYLEIFSSVELMMMSIITFEYFL